MKRNQLIEKLAKTALRVLHHEYSCKFFIIQKCDRSTEIIKTDEAYDIKSLLPEFNFVQIKKYPSVEFLNMNLVRRFQLVQFPGSPYDFGDDEYLHIYPVGSKQRLILDADIYYLLAERFPAKMKKTLIKR